jgi:hypothetical protein
MHWLVSKFSPASLCRRQRRLLLADHRKYPGFLRIDLDPMFFVIRQVFLGQDCFYWAYWNASPAIDTHVVVDVDHLRVAVKASDRAHRKTLSESAKLAIIGDHDRHRSLRAMSLEAYFYSTLVEKSNMKH